MSVMLTTLRTGDSIGELPPESVVFGQTEAMHEVRLKLDKLADMTVPVLIQAESGTGKEIIAKLLHRRSPWSSAPFVKVNCPAIPGTLVESELFGYEKGAFTGADNSKPGRVELANGGTLFLDEISELEGTLQAKLLQLLQDGKFYSIGGRREKQVEVRFLCATNRDLENATETGRFRHDLFYRIKVVMLRLPSLRDRACDIPELANYFLAYYCRTFNRIATPLSTSTIVALKEYPWPGNIRELENLIKTYVIFGSEETIRSALAASNYCRHRNLKLQPGIPPSLKKALGDFEARLILQTLESNHWNRRRTAKSLQISYRSLIYKLKQHKLDTAPLCESLSASTHLPMPSE